MLFVHVREAQIHQNSKITADLTQRAQRAQRAEGCTFFEDGDWQNEQERWKIREEKSDFENRNELWTCYCEEVQIEEELELLEENNREERDHLRETISDR